MKKDPTEFRKRFAAWKSGKKPYLNGRPEPIQRIDNSEADFAQRLRSKWRQEVWDWEGTGKAATHKLSSADNIIYPNVLTTKGGGLIDFTHPMWQGVVDPYLRAIRNKDYVPMRTEGDAMWTGPNYKLYYPSFENGLPKYKDGKSVLNNYTNAKFNDDGTFTDDTTRVFDDFYVTPSGVKTKYGSYTDKNWDRYKQQEQFFKTHDQQTGKLKYEPGLEIVSPEFDLISSVRGIIGTLPKKATTITTKNAAKITPKLWDESYMSAIINNDIKEVQRLRDLHFKIKAPKSKAVNANGMPTKQYHTVADGYPAEFNEFNPNIEGTHSAIYTSDSPIMSGTYSNKIVSDAEREYYINAAILNMKLQLKEGYVSRVYKKEMEAALESDASSRAYVLNKLPWLKLPTQAARQKALYANIENPLIIEGAGKHWNNIPISNLPKDVYKALKSSQMNGYTTRDIELAQKLTGNYDGAIIRNITDYGSSWKSTTSGMKPSTVYQINNPRNLKYADLITYDDAGKIIPLSQRDNFNIADLRYGIIPTLIGGSVYLTYK